MSESSVPSGGPAKPAAGSVAGVPQFFIDLAKNAPAMMWVFTATTFLSALLLFAIQPMFAKMVLPVLGGSPSVWSVSVFFFQGALLAGYIYAHLLINKAPPHLTGIIHLGVCLLAVICLPIGLSTRWGDPPHGEPYLWQLGVFTASIGLPFMAVSANAPLLQAWFARSGHPNARDPYFLYAASNLGSLIALLSYPFVLEPAFGLSELSYLWAYAYGALVIALAGSFFLMRGAQASGVPETPALPVGADVAAPPPTLQRRLGWVGLAFVPAALVTALTVHITTDVASAPLLWVIPLALYLLTFVLVFRDNPFVSRDSLLFLHLVALVVALITLSQTSHDSWFVTSSTGVAVFFTTAMVAHRTLYEARPAPRYLTEFYLWMSFGGALGGMFTALVAPKLFSQIFEYPLLLALSIACRPGAFELPVDREKRKDELIILWLIAAVGTLVIMWLPTLAASYRIPVGEWGTTILVVTFLSAILIGSVQEPPRQLMAALLIAVALIWLPSGANRGESQRSFFGVYRVHPSADGVYKILIHGTTLHGAQRFYGEDGNPVDDTVPTTYYYPGSPIGQTIAKRREILAKRGEKGRYGIVGLGTGSSSCHKREGETWRFFEIDPTVIKISKNPKNFTFITKCQPDIDIVIGDARQTMSKEDDASFDLFIIDAFTSDAIPVHMLTAEAVKMYLAKLKPDGVVLLHTSNRYLDLDSVLSAIHHQELPPGTAGIVVSDNNADGSYGQSTSTVVIFTKSEEALAPYRSMDGVSELDDGGLRGWTDDYSDILGAFLNRYWGRG
jgi:hypothetical protein